MSNPARWPARRSPGGDAALWVASGILFVALAALVFGGSREPGPTMLVVCFLAAMLAFLGTALLVWAVAYQRLAYTLTDASMQIEWLGHTVVVPYPAIHGIYTGQRLAGHATPGLPRWPGINVGPARVRGLGRLRFYATSTDQSALTFITVENGGVIISAGDPQAFQTALIERVERCQDMSGPGVWRQTPPNRAPWTALADAWLPAGAAIATLLILVLLGVIDARYAALPDQIPLRFDAGGQPNQIASKFDLLRLPLFGLGVMLLDLALGAWLHPRERMLARLLWLGGGVVQVVLLVGVLRLVA